ncbi:hypothetical protein WNX13_11585, partial [Lactobacillus delbrueckii]|uniref:hypothetical protein n=1 Tax=Lactobacillus delbrueckii TaxID=1584 RepID=UPI0030E8BE59
SQGNLEKLLVHKRATMMLLRHPLTNARCLLLNLFFTHHFQGLIAITQNKSSPAAQKLNEILSTIGDDEYDLRLALYE